MTKHIAIIGAGVIGREYAKILRALGRPFLTIGRSAASCAEFGQQLGEPALPGGLEAWLESRPEIPSEAIVAVNVGELSRTSQALFRAGVKRLLIEKPAGLDPGEMENLLTEARRAGAEAYVAYNRRFLASTQRAKEIIEADGGVRSFYFDFSEWSHVIEPLPTPAAVKQAWLLANSSHVIDLAFFLGGAPESLRCLSAGSLSWHAAGAKFAGSGRTQAGALFAYLADWEGPGRWGLELITARHRLVFRPLEQLQIQKKGSVAIELAPLDLTLDQKFKPGFYRQTEAFLAPRPSTNLLSLEAHVARVREIYVPIRDGK